MCICNFSASPMRWYVALLATVFVSACNQPKDLATVFGTTVDEQPALRATNPVNPLPSPTSSSTPSPSPRPVSDTQAPSVPLALTGTAVSSNQINLTWAASSDNTGVAGYKVYRNGIQIGLLAERSFSDTNLTAFTTYSYTVAAYDAAGNSSAQSNAISVRTAADADTLPPTVPTALNGTSVHATQINLLWSPSFDNVGVTSYKVFRNNVLVGTSLSTRFNDWGLLGGSTYTYKVAAEDAAGNVSAQTENIQVTTFSSNSYVTSTTAFQNLSYTSQRGIFTAHFDLIPNGNNIDAEASLTSGPGSTLSAGAVTVRFNSSGYIDACNGAVAGCYRADAVIPYQAGRVYHFRLEVDVPSRLFDVYVTLPGGAEESLLAHRYQFRAEAPKTSELNNLMFVSTIPSLQIGNFRWFLRSYSIMSSQEPTYYGNEEISYELGLQFQSAQAGTINAIRFFKTPVDIGTHVGNIWSATGIKLATVTFSGETASGWQSQALSVPLAINANTTYVVSVNTPNYYYPNTSGGITTSIVNGPLSTVASSYITSPGQFPTIVSATKNNYFRDVVFTPTPNGASGTLGFDVIGTVLNQNNANRMSCSSFTMGSQGGIASSISFYIAATDSSPNNKWAGAIYSDSSGSPANLIASTAASTAVANSWNVAPLTANLAANMTYWECYNTNSASVAANQIKVSPGATGQHKWSTQVFGTWPTTFPGVEGVRAEKISSYVTYSPQ